MPTFCEPWPGIRNASFPMDGLLSLYDREHDVRRPGGVVEDGLARGDEVLRTVGAERSAGVRVAIEARERAAGHDHADPVALQERVRGRHEIDRVLEHLAGRDQLLGAVTVAEARADDALGEDPRAALGVDVGEL